MLTRCCHFYKTHFSPLPFGDWIPGAHFSYDIISSSVCLWSSGFYGLIRCFCKKKINETKTDFRGIADSFVRIYNTLLYTFQSEYLLLINRGPPVIYWVPLPPLDCSHRRRLWADALPVFRHDIWVVLFVCQWYQYLYDYDIHDCCLPQPTT